MGKTLENWEQMGIERPMVRSYECSQIWSGDEFGHDTSQYTGDSSPIGESRSRPSSVMDYRVLNINLHALINKHVRNIPRSCPC